VSYDIYLIPLGPSGDAQAYFDDQEVTRDELDLLPKPEAERRKRELADRLRASGVPLEEFEFDFARIAERLGLSVEEARQGWRHVELNSPEDGPGIQIELQDESAKLGVPYWHAAERAEPVWDQVWTCLRILRDVGGYSPFDPQLGRVLDLDRDRGDVVAMYAEGVADTNQLAPVSNAVARRAWWNFG